MVATLVGCKKRWLIRDTANITSWLVAPLCTQTLILSQYSSEISFLFSNGGGSEKRRKFLRQLLLFLPLFLAVGSIQADVVASYQSDYVVGSTAGQTRAAVSNDGWNYLSNSAGAIGTSANYTSLVWNPTAVLGLRTAGYTFNSTQYPYDVPGTSYDNYVGLFGSGAGHTGRGSSQNSGINGYAIAAYTIQAGEAGSGSISSGTLTANASAIYPLLLKIYVNDTLKGSYSVNAGATQSFSDDLGTLSVDDKVYVAVGAGAFDENASFTLNYSITSVPEPGTLALFTLGSVSCALALVRKRRRKQWIAVS